MRYVFVGGGNSKKQHTNFFIQYDTYTGEIMNDWSHDKHVQKNSIETCCVNSTGTKVNIFIFDL